MTIKRLYPYQIEDVEELKKRPRIILGSVMRAGKMVETFELVKQLKLLNVLVICPHSMVSEWNYMISEWGADKECYDVLNYEKLRKIDIVDLIVKASYDLIVFDECHYIKNHKAKQTMGAYLIGSSSPRVILASGTPMQNSPQDLYPLLRIIDPSAFPAYWQFVEHFCDIEQLPRPPYPRIIVGAKNKAELRVLLKKYMLRREREELLDWEGNRIVMDRKPTRTVPVTLDDRQLENYITMEEELFAILDSGEKITASVTLAQMMRLRQICLEPSLLSPNSYPTHPSPKTRLLLDLIGGASSPLIVYTYFEKYAKVLNIELTSRNIPHVLFTGKVSDGIKHNIVREFQAGKHKVLIGTIKSLGLGLPLSASHTVVFADYWWNPAVNDQAASRAEGAGQTELLEIIDMWAQGTIEDHMHRVVSDKSKTFKDVIVATIASMRKARSN